MAFTVPPLPYDYDALESTIDVETMKLHHDKHHQAYVDNANKALEGHRPGRRVRRGGAAQPRSAARGQADGGPQQRRRPRQPLALLGDHGPAGGWLAERRARERDRLGVRQLRLLQGDVQPERRDTVRQRLDLARVERQRARGVLDSQPGLADPPGPRSRARQRRLGARVLPDLPEPPPRVPRGLVERRQLGRRGGPLRRRRRRSRRRRPWRG